MYLDANIATQAPDHGGCSTAKTSDMRPVPDIVFRTSEPAYVVDQGGQVVAWNNAAEKAFGYDARQVVGKKCWQLLCGKDTFGNDYCGQGCPVLKALIHKKAVNRFRLSLQTAHNGPRNFTISVLLLRSCTGREFVVHLCRGESVNGTSVYNGFSHHPGRGRGQLGNLTKREHEILFLLAEGRSTREISSAISVSIHTVRNHVQHILNKFQVDNRVKAITLGRRLGII